MAYLCIKKLMLAGKTYTPGDIIPESVFLGGRVDKLTAYGYIRKANPTVEEKPPEKVAEAPKAETVKSETEKAEKAESKPAKKVASQSPTAKKKDAASTHTT